MTDRHINRITAALLALAGVVVVAFGLAHTILTLTGTRPYDQPLFDEPLFAEMSRVAADGGLLYTDQWDHKPPVLFWMLAGFIRAFGNQILTIKLATVAVNAVFVVVMAALAWFLTRSPKATAITSVLAFGLAAWQGYLEGYNSVFIMATFAAGAVLAAHVARGRVPYLLLSGGLLAASFFTKQVMIFEAPAALAFAWASAPEGRRSRAAAWVVVGGLLGVGAMLAYTGVRGNLADLWYGSFYTGLLYSFEPDGGAWHFSDEFAGFFRQYFVRQTLPFLGVLLAWSVLAAGVGLWDRQTRPTARLLLLWVLGAFLGAAIGRSLRRQYFIEMLPSLLALNALALTVYARWRPAVRLALAGAVVAALALNVLWARVRVPPDALALTSPNTLPNGDGLTTNEIAAQIDGYLAAGECVWNWDGLGYLNYLSGHGSCTSAPHAAALMVREAFDIEANRDETLRELFAARPRLHVVQPIWGYFPELERFADRYRGERLLSLTETGGFVEVYAVDMSPFHPATASFGGLFDLVGYDLYTPPEVCAGDDLRLALTWRTHETPTRYYNTFVQLLTPDGTARAAGLDAQPHSRLPTITWRPGAFLLGDTLTLSVPPETPPGAYVLAHGFYDAETSERLPVTGADGAPLPGGFVALAGVTVRNCG